MSTEEQTKSHLETFRGLVAGGMSHADACRAMMRDHGLSLDEAADLSWLLNTGKRSPDFKNNPAARRSWERGAYNRQCGE